jgi:hypothetical protein
LVDVRVRTVVECRVLVDVEAVEVEYVTTGEESKMRKVVRVEKGGADEQELQTASLLANVRVSNQAECSHSHQRDYAGIPMNLPLSLKQRSKRPITLARPVVRAASADYAAS